MNELLVIECDASDVCQVGHLKSSKTCDCIDVLRDELATQLPQFTHPDLQFCLMSNSMSSGRKPITTEKIIIAVVLVVITIVILACLVAGALIYIHISEKKENEKFANMSAVQRYARYGPIGFKSESPSVSNLTSSIKEGVQTGVQAVATGTKSLAASVANIFKPASKNNDEPTNQSTTTATLPDSVKTFIGISADLVNLLNTYSKRTDLDSSNSLSDSSSQRSYEESLSYTDRLNSISTMLKILYTDCNRTINNPLCDKATRDSEVNIIRTNIVKAIEIVDQYRKTHGFKNMFDSVFADESNRSSADTSTSTSTSTTISTSTSTQDKFREAAEYMNEVIDIVNKLYGTNVLGCSSLMDAQSAQLPRA